MAEATKIVGAAIGSPIFHTGVADDRFEPHDTTGHVFECCDVLLEMTHALNTGYMKALEPLSTEHDSNVLRTFVADTFVLSLSTNQGA